METLEIMSEEKPYIRRVEVKTIIHIEYNPKYGGDRICKCGHPYERHFDPYEKWEAVGCKYCQCYTFEEETDEKAKKSVM